MRALLIGRRFMAAYREAQGGQKKPSRLSEWFDWVRERTAPELQWMWSNHRAYKDEHTDAYAQVAGDLILKPWQRMLTPKIGSGPRFTSSGVGCSRMSASNTTAGSVSCRPTKGT